MINLMLVCSLTYEQALAVIFFLRKKKRETRRATDQKKTMNSHNIRAFFSMPITQEMRDLFHSLIDSDIQALKDNILSRKGENEILDGY